MVASSSFSSVESPPHNQVFINFRGEQLRNGFVSHLVKAMKIDGINVYIDEDEPRGNELTTLFDRIEESKVALAIFSSQYSESKWCLNELVRINECAEVHKLVVIPIFYKIDTNDVKNLKGVFGDNFGKLAKDHSGETMDKWKKALKAVPRKFAITINETRKETDYISQIIWQVMEVLKGISKNLERKIPIENPGAGDEETAEVAAPDSVPSLFGIETHINQFKEMLNSNRDRIFTIGVVGMPGIGKTTLTEKLYEKFQHSFTRKAFLPNVRDLCKKGTMGRSILTSELLRKEDVIQQVPYMSSKSLKALLLDKKCLVVLDNVSEKIQIQVLLGECDWITKGSLIIITTSDRSVIEGKVNETYEVLRLSGHDSLQCFSYYAFSGHICNLEGNFMNLCKEFVDYAKGNPFVLKILGGELKGKNQAQWEETLGKLAQSPNKTIKNALQVSYNELGQLQEDVFLDVACFFRSGDEYYVRSLVESCENELTVSEIKDLACKFLINISGGRVEMHDLLYTFGKELGSAKSCRVLDQIGFVDALKNTEGQGTVRGIFLDMSKLKNELLLDKYIFTKMCNLRYLKFYNSRCHRECEADYKLNIPDGLKCSLNEIRYLYWLKYPMKNLPEDFNPKNLTDLSLPYSKIEEVWVGVKNTPKLKWVDLSYSSKLCNLSGLLNAESLQRLNLEGCTRLKELPEGMKRMKSLIFLNMRGCTSLRVLPEMNLISLKTLILTNCSSLQKFQVISDNLETLHLDGTAIVQLPTNLVKLQRLIVLNLKDCKKLVSVPECLEMLKALQELLLSGCSELESFPITIENMNCLQILLLDGTRITDMPQILQFNSSRVEDLSSLRRLCLSGNNMISNLQIDISRLHQLKCLDLKYCKNLISIPLLPPNLEILDAHGCDKLKTVAMPMALLKLMEQVQSKFIFTNCNNLEEAAKNSITSYAQRKSQLDAVRCYKEGNVSEPFLVTSFPGSEVPSWFKHCRIGSKLKLELQPHRCDKRLSTVALCAVVAFPSPQVEINRFSIECTYEFKNKNETCISFSCILGGGWIEPRKIDSEHVFIGYISSSHIKKHLEGSLQSEDNHECGPPEASIEFKVRDGAGEIVNCGLSLVYEEPNHVVIEGNDEETNHVVTEGNNEEPNHVVIEGNNEEPNPVVIEGTSEEPNHVVIEGNETSSRTDLSVGERIVSFAAAFLSIVLRFPWVGLVFFLAYGFARFFR